MSRPDKAANHVTSVLIAGTVMLSCSSPAHAGHNGGFRDFRQQHSGLDSLSLRTLWRQSQSALPPLIIQPAPNGGGSADGVPPVTGLTVQGPPMTIQPIIPGGGSNPNAPPVTGGKTNIALPPITIQPMPTGGGSNPDAPAVTGGNKNSSVSLFTIQPMPTGGGSNPDAPAVTGGNKNASVPPITIQPMPTGGGSNPDAPAVTDGNKNTQFTIQPMPTGAGSNPDAPAVTGGNITLTSTPPMTIQPIPTGGGSNPDAPAVTDGNKNTQFTIQPMPTGAGSNPNAPAVSGGNITLTTVPPITIQPIPTGGGSNPDAPAVTGGNINSTSVPPITIQPMPTGAGSNLNAPAVTGGAINLESPPLTIQPMPIGGGSNSDAPPVSGSTGRHNHGHHAVSLPPVSIQPMKPGGGSNDDAPPIPGGNSGNDNSNRHNMRSSQTDDSGNRISIGGGIDIDLSSSDQNIKLGTRLFGGTESVTIEVGGVSKTLTAGSKVTAAEYLAVRQVLSGNGQQLVLNNAGSATGGSIDFTSISSRSERVRVDDLSIPVHVTAFGDFSRTPLFSVSGDLDNAGNIFAYSFSGNRGGGISADKVINEASGLISTQQPPLILGPGVGAAVTAPERPFDLTIHAHDSLSNFGTISATGELVLSAGNEVSNAKNGVLSARSNLSINAPKINNAGLISSEIGNVNLNGPSTETLQVTNTGGTISAANGDINLRDSSYNDVFNTYVTGGNLFSNAVNVYAGQGSAEINVDQLTGTLNQSGTASHVVTNTATLKLGNICLTGDPTYSNQSGNISLDGNITVGEALSIIASGDITASVPVTLTANSPTQGFNVSLVAGAAITSGGSTSNVGPIPPALASDVTTISGAASGTGGNIILGVNGAVNINTSPSGKGNFNGGNVFLAAYSAGGLNGSIQHTLGTITTGGRGTGSNGDVNMIAGAQAPAFDNSMSTITTTGGTGGGGDVTFLSDQPTSAGSITFAADGSASGSLTPAGTTLTNVSTFVRGQITAAGDVQIKSGTIKWLPLSKVGINNVATPGSTIDLAATGSGGIEIGNSNFFSTNTLLVNSGTGNIGQGGVVALQTNASKIVATGDAALSEIVIVSSNTGLVLFNGSADTLNLGCVGTFMTDPSLAPITANTALIGSFAAGTGLNSFNPVEVAADNLYVTASSKGDLFAHNSNATTTTLFDAGKMLANKTFSLVSDNDLSMQSTAFINADNVILTTSNNFGTLNGTIDGDVSVTLTMKNDLTNTNVPAAFITPLLKLVSTNGNIGTSTAARFNVSAGALAVTATATAAGKSVFLQGPAAVKSFKIAGGSSSGVFDYTGPGSVTITGSLTSGLDSDINVVLATGTLTTQGAQIHSGRDILLQVADTVSTKIKIVLGANSDIFTDSNPSAGQITIALGNITQVTGTPPAKGVSFFEFGAGADIFWGTAGVSGKGQNFVIAQGADVTFSNALTSKSISLGGNVSITADPPITGSQSVGGGGNSGRIGSGPHGFATLLLGTTIGAQSTASGSTGVGVDTPVNSPISQAFGLNTNDKFGFNANNTVLSSALDSSVIAQTTTNILTASQTAAAANDNADDETYLISSGPAASICGGSLCTDGEMYYAITSERFTNKVFKSNVAHVESTSTVAVSSGKTLFAPTQNMIVRTAFGDIELSAGSITLVSANETGVALFNIHDSSKNAVSLKVEGQSISVSPGRHILLTKERSKEFANLNQVETIQHRNIDRRIVGRDMTLYSSEFSTLSAMDTVLPLRAVCASSHPQSKKLAAKMLKTTAVIMQLAGPGEYRHYVKPRLTALASR